jgi:hypothetical protein
VLSFVNGFSVFPVSNYNSMLAEAAQVPLSEYAEQALLFLMMLGGSVVLLGSLILGGSAVSSTSSRSRKYGPVQDSLDTNKNAPTEELTAVQATCVPRLRKGKRRERRAWPRREGNPTDVLITTAKEAEPEKAFVIDRSRGGLRLSVSRPMAVGTTFHVRACHAPEDLPPIQVLVRHCSQKEQRWHVGCQFMESLPWSVLLLFG